MGREDKSLNIERRKIAELKNDPANARKHSPRNLKAIRDSLDVFGQQKPIVIDSRGVVIAGNGTLEAARDLGWDEIDVAVTDLDPAHAQAFGIADNRTAELAEWDTDVLGQLLEGMDSDLADILSIDDLELPDSIDGGGQGEGLTDPDEVPEPPDDPITQTGDLWLLGEHRLLCGDSTSAEDVGRLMDGATADALITDPPYGIKIGSQSQGKGGGLAKKIDYGENNWDNEIPKKAILFGMEVSEVCVLWGANYYTDILQPSSCWLVWDKDNGASDFADVEVAWTNLPKSSRIFKYTWAGMRQEDMKNKEKRVHPTQKPVALSEWIFEKLQIKTNVLDLFCGSGSTLIASEKTGRKCYGMEIDPKYCDVIVKRWEDFTGQTATREATN
ncbi:MAG: DNA methyltransferase [Pseudomonadales bacterium]